MKTNSPRATRQQTWYVAPGTERRGFLGMGGLPCADGAPQFYPAPLTTQQLCTWHQSNPPHSGSFQPWHMEMRADLGCRRSRFQGATHRTTRFMSTARCWAGAGAPRVELSTRACSSGCGNFLPRCGILRGTTPRVFPFRSSTGRRDIAKGRGRGERLRHGVTRGHADENHPPDSRQPPRGVS